jgi:hypothetical protein
MGSYLRKPKKSVFRHFYTGMVLDPILETLEGFSRFLKLIYNLEER